MNFLLEWVNPPTTESEGRLAGLVTPRNLAVVLFIAFFLLAATGHIVVFDGAHFLYTCLAKGSATIKHGRWSYFPFYPLVLSLADHNVPVAFLRFVFGLGFDLFTTGIISAAIALAWRNALLVGAVLVGIMAGCLPGQILSYCEATHVGQLGGLLLILGAVASWRGILFAGPLIAVFLFGCHPASALAFAAFSLVLLVRWLRSRTGWFLAFSLVGGLLTYLRATRSFDSYEAGEMTLPIIKNHFFASFLGLPLVFVSAALLAVVSALLADRARTRAHQRDATTLGWVSILSSLTFTVTSLLWASEPRHWREALDYRQFSAMIPLSACTIASLVVLTNPPRLSAMAQPIGLHLKRVASIIVATFSATLLMQGLHFNRLLGHLHDGLAGPPRVLSFADLAWTRQTPLHGWHLAFNALLAQGRAPGSLVLPDSEQALFLPLKEIDLAPGKPLWPAATLKYFDFQHLQAAVAELRRTSKTMAMRGSVVGGHGMESDATGWWVWTPDQLEISFRLRADRPIEFKLSFQYLAASLPRTLVLVQGTGAEATERLIPMEAGWQAWTSTPFVVSTATLAIRFTSPEPPVPIGTADARLAAFLIKNVRLEPLDHP